MRELPRVMMVAAHAQWAKNDAQVQTLVDKTLADLTVLQQDEQARLTAFTALVQAERGGDQQAIRTAREGLRTATEKLQADAKQVFQDTEPLEKRLNELRPPEPTGRRGQAGAQ